MVRRSGKINWGENIFLKKHEKCSRYYNVERECYVLENDLLIIATISNSMLRDIDKLKVEVSLDFWLVILVQCTTPRYAVLLSLYSLRLLTSRVNTAFLNFDYSLPVQLYTYNVKIMYRPFNF